MGRRSVSARARGLVMRTILVVHSVETRSARVWVCVTGVDGTPPPVTVRVSNGAAGTVGSDAWNPVTAGDVIPRCEVRTFFQVVRFTGLPSGAAMIASANEAQTRFSTLPAALPRVGQRPLSPLGTSEAAPGRQTRLVRGHRVAVGAGLRRPFTYPGYAWLLPGEAQRPPPVAGSDVARITLRRRQPRHTGLHSGIRPGPREIEVLVRGLPLGL